MPGQQNQPGDKPTPQAKQLSKTAALGIRLERFVGRLAD